MASDTYLLHVYKHLETMLVNDKTEKKTVVVIRFITFTFNVFSSGEVNVNTSTGLSH